MVLVSLLVLSVIIQLVILCNFLFPMVLKMLSASEGHIKDYKSLDLSDSDDYAIIVTYYRELNLLPGLLRSINELNYENFIVYIVADCCEAPSTDISLPPNVVLLFPPEPLGNNIKSHRFAIDNFVRSHNRITIVDGDNEVHPEYIGELNKFFDRGYPAVQGAREPKNLNTHIAGLDAAGDLYYRYIDRKLLFEAGSSSTLSGSGMAFATDLYKQFVENVSHDGAGFDKVLQFEIVKKGCRIAFAPEAIVFDQKTTHSDQLVKQRARWIKTWLVSWRMAAVLLSRAILSGDRNALLFSIATLRPPLFLTLSLLFAMSIVNFLTVPFLNVLPLISFFAFLFTFSVSLRKFDASPILLGSLKAVPKFVLNQFFSLLSVKRADLLSVATVHSVIPTEPIRNETNSSQKPFRILHVIRQGKVGGGEKHVLDLVTNLDEKRFKSYVLCFSDGPMVVFLRSISVPVFVIPTEAPFNYTIRRSVSRIVLENRIDVLHAHGTRAFSNCFFVRQKLGIPTIYTVHGWSFHQDQSRLTKWMRVSSEKYLIKRADTTVLVSNSDLLDGKRHFGNFNHKIIRNAVDLSSFDPSKSYCDLRGELGISDETFLVGFIARVTKQKNLKLLIDAVSRLGLNPKIKALIVGDGELKEELLQYSRETGVIDRLIFLDFRSDIPNVLNAIDAYCLPSLWEGLSIGLLEAMAMGKAIVASDIPGNMELISDGETGLLTKNNPDDLAQCILRLYHDQSLRERLGFNALRIVRLDFKIDDMVEKLEMSYLEALNSPTRSKY
jgi:glycosyltransferase involved in cell wall biosynthesis/cellulose synthase/poly-beta-1,6-N-acetylglucosamine synthase-like glycosyltransferase